MTPPVAIIDTNVIVSGLIGAERASPTTVILDAMLDGRFTYLLSLDLLAEYRRVLIRSAIRRRHGLTDAEVDAILTELAFNGTLVNPGPPTTAPPDVGNRHLRALLNDAAAAGSSRETLPCGGARPNRPEFCRRVNFLLAG